jgi:amidophosphoribosyltransferase
MHDTVGFVGVFGRFSAATLAARGLRGLATRGGDVAGLVAIDGMRVRSRRSCGVAWLADEAALDALTGRVALGATLHLVDPDVARDTALGLIDPPRLPATAHLDDGPIALLVSGGLVTVPDGVIGAADASDAVLQLVRRSGQRTAVNRLVDALHGVQGGFAVLLATRDRLVVATDPQGVRPAVVGALGEAVVVASDTRALLRVGAVPVRALSPGEVVVIDDNGIASLRPFPRRRDAPCTQEVLSLGAGDDVHAGRSIEGIRQAIGAELARLSPAAADVVTCAPGQEAVALGWSRAMSMPLEPLLIDGHASPSRVAGRVVVLISRPGAGAAEVRALLAAGASDVHLRWPGPAPVQSCPFGVAATPSGDAPVRAGLSLVELRAVVTGCDGCLGGSFAVTSDARDGQLPLFRG